MVEVYIIILIIKSKTFFKTNDEIWTTRLMQRS